MADVMKRYYLKMIGWTVVSVCVIILVSFSIYQYKTIDQKNSQLNQITEENARLVNSNDTLNTNLTEITTTVDEIATRIQDIKQRNVTITQLVAQATEGGKKESILSDIAMIENQLQHDRKQLDDLMTKMAESGVRIKSLESVVRSLESEINGYVRRIENFKSIVAHKNELIRENETALSKMTDELSLTRTSLDMTEQELSETKQTLNKTINTAYYIVGTKNQLKNLNVIDEKGWFVFNKDINLAANIDDSVFTQIDISKQAEFQIERDIDDITILPARVGSSYMLEKSGNHRSVLKISDPNQFWKIKYLAVLVKGSSYDSAMAVNMPAEE